MANNVTGKVMGGQGKVLNSVNTVQDVYNKLELSGNYTATVKGQPAEMNDSVSDFDFVSFAVAVKGGK